MENILYTSITQLVGHTPLIELSGYERKHKLQARIFGKLESFNPSGSVKDRAALQMIIDAEKTGRIKPGDTILDFTSGNTGIALAAYSNALGYHYAAVIQPGVSEERTQILKAYGTTFLTFDDIPGIPEMMAARGMIISEMYIYLQRYADEHGWFFINQGENLSNPEAHYHTTGPEIWEAAKGKVDYAVMLVGTGGTMVGVGRYLREKNPHVKIIGAQPALISRKDPAYPERNTIDGVLAFSDVEESRVPYFFKKYNFHWDECLDITAEDAYQAGREVVRSDGIFLGQSASAAVKAATIISQRSEAVGKNIVTILPDDAYKYLSTNIYR